MKLLASKFNEKKFFSQISAVRTGVRAHMDATPLVSYARTQLAKEINLHIKELSIFRTNIRNMLMIGLFQG